MTPADETTTFTITLEPSGQCFTAQPGETVLQAALRARVYLRTSCRQGTCRECICRLTQGDVCYSVPWPGLSIEEKRERLTLTCVAVPQSDLVLGPL